MTLLARIADRVLNRPLLIHPQKAEVIAYVLGGRIGLDDVLRPSPEANRLFGEPRAPDGGERAWYNIVGGAAVVTIEGSLVNRGAWVGASSGLVSYEGIAAQVTAAAQDEDAAGIVLDIDSPGGEAGGMAGLAETLRAARAVKPVVALVNDMAASAAYGIAAQAHHVVVSASSIVGSIGVVMLHADHSGALKARGIAPTLIFAGEHKVDGHPFGPLPAAVKADLQREVDQTYELFLDLVAAGRGDRLTVAAARATQARVLMGAEAIAAGLADSLGGLPEALAIAANLSSPGPVGPSLASTRSDSMSERPEGAPGAAIPGNPAASAARASVPAVPAAPMAADLYAHLRNTGGPAGAESFGPEPGAGPSPGPSPQGGGGQAQASVDPRERIKAILALEEAKGREAQAQAIAIETDLSVDQARAILATAPKAGPGTATIAERARGNGTDVSASAGRPDPSAGWDEAVAKVNAQYGVGARK
jgi:signal peptide peptidase SppA